jgi:hypothetical protein
MEDDIFIDESEMFEEVIPGKKLRFNFPAVYFYRASSVLVAYFNKLAVPMMADAERVQVKMSSRFIVFLPSDRESHNTFSKNSSHTATLSVTSLTGIVPEETAFRCYPYKGGIAIKRFEPLQEDEE